jgi:hypothetical protein
METWMRQFLCPDHQQLVPGLRPVTLPITEMIKMVVMQLITDLAQRQLPLLVELVLKVEKTQPTFR